ncbi:MAG TPA: hypothetical protein VMI53_00590 [Opitutaceae bacterium]|nr:hypothetical protein [Opitutaceae bacterium]
MTATHSTGNPVITVEGAAYVIKVGSTDRFPGRPRDQVWYVVAFARDLDWQRHVPLAGPFETRAKATEALERYLDQPSYPALARDEIARAIRKS